MSRRGSQRGRTEHQVLVALAIILVLLGLYYVEEVYGPVWAQRRRAGPAIAVGSLRTINTAETTYTSTYPRRGFSRTLLELGTPADGHCPAPSPNQACLINSELAQGRRAGYIFTYTPGPESATGVVQSYSVRADPDPNGPSSWGWHLYSDQSSIVRVARDAPATKDSPPLQ